MYLAVMIAGLTGLVMMALPGFSRHGRGGRVARHGGARGARGAARPGAARGGAARGHVARHAGVARGHGAARAGVAKGHVAAKAGVARGHVAAKAGVAKGHVAAKAGVAKGHVAAKAGAAKGHVPARAGAGQGSNLPAPARHANLTRYLPDPRAVFSVLALFGAFGNLLAHAVDLSWWLAALLALLPAVLVEYFVIRPIWNLVFRFEGAPTSPLSELLLEDAEAVTAFHNGKGMVSVVRDGRRVQFQARLTDEQASRPVHVGDRLWVEDVDPEHERLTVSVPEG